jgi:hypothetical protein
MSLLVFLCASLTPKRPPPPKTTAAQEAELLINQPGKGQPPVQPTQEKSLFFGTPLSKIAMAGTDARGIPTFLSVCCDVLGREKSLREEGILRLSPSHQHLETLCTLVEDLWRERQSETVCSSHHRLLLFLLLVLFARYHACF